MQPIVTVAPQYRGIPVLKSDAHMAKLPGHCKLERRIVWNLLRHLKANGWMPVKVYDGGEYVAVKTATEAMEAIFSVDDSRLYVSDGSAKHSILLIAGNGCDIVSDYSYAEGHTDSFDAVMDAFDASACE